MGKRLQSYAETAIGEYQCGFRPGRSTTDQLIVVRQNAEKFWEYNIDLHQLFIDFRQAYDSINRRKMYEIQEQGIPQKLIGLIRMTMTGTNSQVQLQGGKTDDFEIHRGLKGMNWHRCCLI
jgi:sorting nexin-29